MKAQLAELWVLRRQVVSKYSIFWLKTEISDKFLDVGKFFASIGNSPTAPNNKLIQAVYGTARHCSKLLQWLNFQIQSKSFRFVIMFPEQKTWTRKNSGHFFRRNVAQKFWSWITKNYPDRYHGRSDVGGFQKICYRCHKICEKTNIKKFRPKLFCARLENSEIHVKDETENARKSKSFILRLYFLLACFLLHGIRQWEYFNFTISKLQNLANFITLQ